MRPPIEKQPGIQIRRVPLDALHLDPANARQHPDENLEAIVGSLRRFGQAEPLVVQKATGRIIGGNGRLVAMRKLGWEEVDVVELEIDDLQATALGIALNRTAETATWNDETLAKLLRELQAEDAMDGVGYSDADLESLLAELAADAAHTGVDDLGPPEPPEVPVSRPGDLWVLGNHRLLCGDSSKGEDVDRLLGGAPIHLVNTDPPYNVKVEPRSNNAIRAGLSSFPEAHGKSVDHERDKTAGHARGGKRKATGQMRAKDRPLLNDFVSDEEFDRLLAAWFGNISRVLVPGGCFYIWGGYANCGNYPPALVAADLYFAQAIIWDKEHPVLTRKDYMGAHEWCFYGWRKGAGHKYYGPTNDTDLWHVKKVTPQSMVHLTEKPVELAVRAIQNSSLPGQNVLDLFGGSGSTLIGCEETGRRGFLMELDPAYTDVIVMRWERATDRDAVLEGTQKTFAQVAEERSQR